MKKSLVAIVKYKRPLDSVRKAVELSRGLDHLPAGSKRKSDETGTWKKEDDLVRKMHVSG